MGRYVQGFDVNQMSFLPLSFDEMIDEDNAVRGIDAIVETLDKEKLNFTHTQTKKTGRPPYDPICMFKINITDWGRVTNCYIRNLLHRK